MRFIGRFTSNQCDRKRGRRPSPVVLRVVDWRVQDGTDSPFVFEKRNGRAGRNVPGHRTALRDLGTLGAAAPKTLPDGLQTPFFALRCFNQ